jgi:hypothetical protein
MSLQGYRTGHLYRDQATSYRHGRSSSEADVTAKKLSIANDSKDLNSLNLTLVFQDKFLCDAVKCTSCKQHKQIYQNIVWLKLY